MRSSSATKRDDELSWRSSRLHIIGDRVSATTPETITAPASVKANSMKSFPVSPPRNPIGAYTAARVSVITMTGNAISRAPVSAAASGSMPSSMWRWMFSTTTIASSTTSPIASTIASSVSRFTEKPSHSISESTPIRDRGIVTTGTITERSEPRNRKMIRITIRLASTRVLTTSSIDSLIVFVPS